MKNTDNQGTFWVIDGLRVKKKKPYKVEQVPRRLHPHQKNIKDQNSNYRPQEPLVVDQKNFFTQKSYQQFADKKIDYGKIRLSSLSSMKGGSLYQLGLHPENNSVSDQRTGTIFRNEFVRFEYYRVDFNILESLEDNMID